MDLKRKGNSKKAIALRYRKEMIAPTILAKGSGTVADRIVTAAQRAGIPIIERAEVVPILFSQEVGTFIPETCYKVIAEILEFVYFVEKKGRI